MKKAIIVGATSGIGKELAFRLADKGYMVGITGRRSELLQEMKLQRPQNFVTLAFDASAGDSSNKLASLIGGLGGSRFIGVRFGHWRDKPKPGLQY